MKDNTKFLLILGISLVAISVASISIMSSYNTSSEKPSHYMGVTREFWLFTSHIPDFNETKMNMPRDIFSTESIPVIKGDKVVIHFFNLEADESHNFSIGEPYDLKVIVPAGENKTISFDAITAGIFTYECTFHLPTMKGQLIVDESNTSER